MILSFYRHESTQQRKSGHISQMSCLEKFFAPPMCALMGVRNSEV